MSKSLALVLLGVMAASARADRAAPPPPQTRPGIPERSPPRLRRPPPPPPPSPAAAIAKEGQAVAGTWTCKGALMTGGGASAPTTATLVLAVDLDGAWIHGKLVAGTLKVELYRTFDPASQQWTALMLSNDGAHVAATSTGEANGVWTWTGEETAIAGTVQRRDYEQRDANAMKLWGERLLGGDWQKSYELSCNR
jgi:hypothetical protein